jgi:chromosome segregation ATPase
MAKIRLAVPVLIAAAILLTTSNAVPTSALDWDTCHDELDRARRLSSDASDAAEEAHAKRGEVESKLNELEECRRYPEIYDLMRDGCRSKRSDYESVSKDYESAVEDFESKMEDLDGRLDSVQSECSYEFRLNRMSALEASNQRRDAAGRRLCTSYKHFMPMLTPQNVLELCKKDMNEQWCKTCLGIQ